MPTAAAAAHTNPELHHLYNIAFTPGRPWLAATVHAGMGHNHTNLLIEQDGNKVIDLGIGGCRPSLSPDGKHIAWGLDDHQIAVADLDQSADEPAVANRRIAVRHAENKVYHVDWSPDGKYLSVSSGPSGDGDLSKPSTHTGACEMVGVHAAGWNIFVIAADGKETVDLANAGEDAVAVTTDGLSNKESDWLAAPAE
jgi:WD40 repeat protein